MFDYLDTWFKYELDKAVLVGAIAFTLVGIFVISVVYHETKVKRLIDPRVAQARYDYMRKELIKELRNAGSSGRSYLLLSVKLIYSGDASAHIYKPRDKDERLLWRIIEDALSSGWLLQTDNRYCLKEISLVKDDKGGVAEKAREPIR